MCLWVCLQVLIEIGWRRHAIWRFRGLEGTGGGVTVTTVVVTAGGAATGLELRMKITPFLLDGADRPFLAFQSIVRTGCLHLAT